MRVLVEHGSELEFAGGASGLKRSGVGLRGLRERTFQLLQFFLCTGNVEIGLLQFEAELAFDALTQAEQRSERETEGHSLEGHIQIRMDSGGERHEALERV